MIDVSKYVKKVDERLSNIEAISLVSISNNKLSTYFDMVKEPTEEIKVKNSDLQLFFETFHKTIRAFEEYERRIRMYEIRLVMKHE